MGRGSYELFELVDLITNVFSVPDTGLGPLGLQR